MENTKIKISRKEYARRYYLKNKEKILDNQKKYFALYSEEIKARRKAAYIKKIIKDLETNN